MTECRQERFYFYNRLAILLKAVENERTTIDLRNEASIYGTVEQADGFMNIVMKDCIFTDPRGDSFNYDLFFVQARNIRCVHIPPKIRIIPAIRQQLQLLSGCQEEKPAGKWTYKQKRALQRQQEGLASVEKLLKDKEQKTETPKEAGNKT